MNDKIFVGITGLARSGKNLFADILRKRLTEIYDISSKNFSLAYALKKDWEQVLKEKFDLNVWSEVESEKEQFRPLLVWSGDVSRKRTNGRYFLEKLQKDLDVSTSRINIITDVRYCQYSKDECHWILDELKGSLVHISKYYLNEFGEKIFVKAPNENEAKNDPLMKKHSDYQVEWQHVVNGSTSYSQLLNDKNLNKIVDDYIQYLLKKYGDK